jgi:hypothetical protein
VKEKAMTSDLTETRKYTWDYEGDLDNGDLGYWVVYREEGYFHAGERKVFLSDIARCGSFTDAQLICDTLNAAEDWCRP